MGGAALMYLYVSITKTLSRKSRQVIEAETEALTMLDKYGMGKQRAALNLEVCCRRHRRRCSSRRSSSHSRRAAPPRLRAAKAAQLCHTCATPGPLAPTDPRCHVQGFQYRLGDLAVGVARATLRPSGDYKGLVIDVAYLPLDSGPDARRVLEEAQAALEEAVGLRRGAALRLRATAAAVEADELPPGQHMALQYVETMSRLLQ